MLGTSALLLHYLAPPLRHRPKRFVRPQAGHATSHPLCLLHADSIPVLTFRTRVNRTSHSPCSDPLKALCSFCQQMPVKVGRAQCWCTSALLLHYLAPPLRHRPKQFVRPQAGHATSHPLCLLHADSTPVLTFRTRVNRTSHSPCSDPLKALCSFCQQMPVKVGRAQCWCTSALLLHYLAPHVRHRPKQFVRPQAGHATSHALCLLHADSTPVLTFRTRVNRTSHSPCSDPLKALCSFCQQMPVKVGRAQSWCTSALLLHYLAPHVRHRPKQFVRPQAGHATSHALCLLHADSTPVLTFRTRVNRTSHSPCSDPLKALCSFCQQMPVKVGRAQCWCTSALLLHYLAPPFRHRPKQFVRPQAGHATSHPLCLLHADSTLVLTFRTRVNRTSHSPCSDPLKALCSFCQQMPVKVGRAQC